jgi:branched-chain amino acid transport system ATP-binding protein
MTGDVPLLRIAGLAAGYGRATVVRDLSLSVGAGEVVALLGPNGAGKTTTLRAVSGLVRPSAGRITVAGDDLTAVPPPARARLGIAHVPEGRGLFPGLTVAEHFRLGHRGERLAAEVGYGHFPALRALRNRRAGLLSGGEQQMLALGRALAREPRLLLIDELSLGLAPAIVRRMLPLVRRHATERGAGVLLVEQHIPLALEIADRAYILSHGRLVLTASAAHLRADPNLVTSSYLGDLPSSQPAPAASRAPSSLRSPLPGST